MAGKANELGALVLFSASIERAVAFYRAIGVQLETEQHDEGPPHYACELGNAHFALFPAPMGAAPVYGAGGCTFPGFVVESVAESVNAVRALGAAVRQEAEQYPWGLRAVIEDPDGRPVEVYERVDLGTTSDE